MAFSPSFSYSFFDTHIFLNVSRLARIEPLQTQKKTNLSTANYDKLLLEIVATSYAAWLVVWHSGNVLALNNVVALRQTRLVPDG